jgi:cytoskeletal protein CcmA (bactofilin family)
LIPTRDEPDRDVSRPDPASEAPSFLAPSGLRASLGPDTAVTGRLSFNQPTRLDGTLRGEVHSTDLLVIGETGFVDGIIRAATVLVLGTVQGDVFAAERIEVGPKGSVKGSLETRQLVVQEGAKVDSDCRIAPARGATVLVLRPKVANEQLTLDDASPPDVSGQSE